MTAAARNQQLGPAQIKTANYSVLMPLVLFESSKVGTRSERVIGQVTVNNQRR
jgi:hypothetical protein